MAAGLIPNVEVYASGMFAKNTNIVIYFKDAVWLFIAECDTIR
jgi:hypothetical protein